MPYIGNNHIAGDHTNNFKVLDDISSFTATFDGSASSVVDTTNNTIRVVEHRFIQGQRVTYTNGGGGNIGGLTTGTAYFIIHDSASTFKLATTASNAASSTAINLSAVGTGSSHTLNAAFDGVNTKFKLTHGSGTGARLNNATQISVAINNVLQRPNLDPNNFADGFALEDNHKIVFQTAPTSEDIFWGSIIANTLTTFDISDHKIDTFTGDGSTTEFTLSHTPANNESLMVTINGVLQHPSNASTARAYTLIASIIQFTAAPGVGDEIQVRHLGFAGATTSDVTGFYGRTGNVVLTSNDHITTGDITSRNINSSGIITATTFDGSFSSSVGGSNANFTGIVTAGVFKGGDFDGRNLNISGIATFAGDVSIGGTLTYEDVTNIDSVGIVTAREGIHIPDNKRLDFGGTAGDGDFEIRHTSGNTFIENNTGAFFISQSGNATSNPLTIHGGSELRLKHYYSNGGQLDAIKSVRGYQTEIYWQGQKKIETTAKGVLVGTGVTIETNGQATFSGITTSRGYEVNGYSDGAATYNYFKAGRLKIYDNGTNNHIFNGYSVPIYIQGSALRLLGNDIFLYNTASSRYYFRGQNLGAASLYWAGSNNHGVHLATTEQGVEITGHSELDNVNIAGVSTFTGAIDANGDLDVDGHTNLDNVSVAGVATFSSPTGLNTGVKIQQTALNYSAGLEINATNGGQAALKLKASKSGTNRATRIDYFNQDSTDPKWTLINDWPQDGSNDFSIRYSNSNKIAINCTPDNQVELFHNGTKKFETGSSVNINSNHLEITSGLQLRFDNSNNNRSSEILNDGSSGNSVLTFKTNGANRWTIDSSGHIVPGTAGAVNIGSASAEIGDVFLADDKSVQLGNSQDFKIYHSSSDNNSYITESGSGDLLIKATQIKLQDASGSDYLRGFTGGAVYLHNAGATKFETTSTGVHVTGEVSASQDYPDFKPSLDLNFAATKKLDPRIKFARQGVASYYDANGNVKFAADNEPRFDHDPDTGECKGLLIEQDSINLIAGSADEGSDTRGVYSTLGNGFAINELVSDVIRPTGTPGLVRRVKSHASSNSGGRWGGYSGSGGSPYAGSFWARSVTGTSQVGIDVNDTGYNVTTLTTKWVRVEAVGTTGNNYDFMDITLPNTSDDIYIWGMQLEQNEYASSYIRNAKSSSQAYRGADTAFIDGESFDEFYNQSEGTMVSSHSLLPNVTATQNCYTYQVAPDSGTSEAPFRLIDRNSSYGNSLVATSITSNSSVAFFRASGNPVTPANKKMKIAFAIKTNDFAASFNGGTVVTDTAGTVSQTNDHISIGYYKPVPQAYLNGHIQRLTYYPKRLSNAQLQNLTS